MIKASVSIYKNNNYLIIHKTKMKFGGWLAQFENVSISLESENSELGLIILNAIRKSEDNYIVNKETDEVSFWKELGYKTFSKFVQNYSMVGVQKLDNVFRLMLWIKEGNHYTPSKELKHTIDLSLDASPSEIGLVVKELFTEKKFSKEFEFKTIYESKLNYQNFDNYDYNDIGDGHTDAYQIYVHDTYDKNYIGFMIDNGYDSFASEDIQNKWKHYYGDLNTFEYKKISNAEYYTKVIATTNELEIQSYLFKDGEGILELIFEIDLLTTPKEEQDKIRHDFMSLVESTKINR